MAALNRPSAGVIPNNIATSQTTVTTSAASIIGQRDLRMKVLIKNIGSGNVFIGPTNAVTTGNGFPIAQDEILELKTTAEIFAIAGSDQDISVLEEYVTTG